MGVPEFDDNNFESEVLQANGPVLVDFWAPWCGPCRQIAPVIEQLAGENAGAIKIGKLNVDDAPNSAQSYGVSSIPTLMIFKDGEAWNASSACSPSRGCRRRSTRSKAEASPLISTQTQRGAANSVRRVFFAPTAMCSRRLSAAYRLAASIGRRRDSTLLQRRQCCAALGLDFR